MEQMEQLLHPGLLRATSANRTNPTICLESEGGDSRLAVWLLSTDTGLSLCGRLTL